MTFWNKFGLIVAACAAEFIGTTFLVLFGCGSTIRWFHGDNNHGVLSISLCFGLSYAVLVNMAAPLSGGHLNPAVTLGVVIMGKLSPTTAFCYFLSHIAGAVAGAAVLFACVPMESRGHLGVTQVVPAEDGTGSTGVGCGVEFLMTFLLVHTMLVCTDGGKTVADRQVAMMLGATVTACHLFGYPITGCGINPARSFGPAVIMNKWTDHWVYWTGPILGACFAAGIYHLEHIFPVSTDNTLVVTGRELEGGSGSPQVKVNYFDDQGNQPSTEASVSIPIPREMKTTV